MTTPFWTDPGKKVKIDETSDVVILGGGFVGLSTAYWLTEIRPDLQITILERRQCGDGASGKNAGFLTKGSAAFYKSLARKWGKERASSIDLFARQSLELTRQHILTKIPSYTPEKSSSHTIFKNESDHQEWLDLSFDPSEFGFRWLEQKELPSHSAHYFGAYEATPEYRVNPLQIVQTLKGILQARKVRILENMPAFLLDREGVKTDSTFIKTSKVIVALNGYSSQFHPAFHQAIFPRRAQMLAVSLDQALDTQVLHYDPMERVYWRMVDPKLLVIGGKRLLDEKGESGDFEKVSPLVQAGLEGYLRDHLRVKFQPVKRWSGIMGFTEDELPIVARTQGPLDAYVIAGFSGHGMGLGFHASLELARLVTGETRSTLFSELRTANIRL